MMNPRTAVSALSMGLLLSGAGSALADQANKGEKAKRSPLELPVTGIATAPDGAKGTFAGTFSLQRFATRDGKTVVAIGMMTGVVTIDAGDPGAAKSVLAGPIDLPVQVSPAGPITTMTAPTGVAAASPVVAAATCQVLNVALGAANLNVLGLQVATQPIVLDISGDSAGVLGNLVCTVLDTLNNVVDLVGLLNQILGLLTGLLGAIIPG